MTTAKRKTRRKRCSECDELKADVLPVGPRWDAGGRNCFQLEWHKDVSPRFTCEACEDEGEEYRTCDGCGAKVCAFNWGAGYLPDDYDGEPLCPDCGAKHFGPLPWGRK